MVTPLTRFFVELPVDKFNNTGRGKVVVEGTLSIGGPHYNITPVAPERVMSKWASGWYKDSGGGWVETEGPARELTFDEWKAIVDGLSDDVKSHAHDLAPTQNEN